MMNNITIVINYIDAIEAQHNAEIELTKTLKLLGGDNYVIGVSEKVSNAYSKLLKEIIGKNAFDWLEWWMWECDFGQKPESLFWANNIKYDASGLTFAQFWDTINDNS